MQKSVLSASAMIFFTLTTLVIVFVSVDMASSVETRLHVYPSSITSNVGTIFTVTINIENVTNLYGYEFKLYWNSSLLEVVSAIETPPEIWNTNYVKFGPGVENDYNATHGRYYRAVAAYPPVASFNGSTYLLVLDFHVKRVGECVLDLVDTKLADSVGKPIPHEAIDGYFYLPFSINVSATSPHVADGIDFSKVTIQAADAHGNPVKGIDLSVIKNQGIDDEKSFAVTDWNNGTYTANVNSIIAGPAYMLALDNASGLSGGCFVDFKPGPLAEVRFLAATNPREGHPQNASEVVVAATDALNNIIGPPRISITITTDLGMVETVEVDENGMFHTMVVSNDLGFANITAVAYDLTYNVSKTATVSVMFPSVYFYAPQSVYSVCDTFTVPVNVYIPNATRALGYYDLTFEFNSTLIQFVNATDGNPHDELEAPITTVGLCMSQVRIHQYNKVNMTSPTGSVDVANLTFKVVRASYPTPATITIDRESIVLNDTANEALPNRFISYKAEPIGKKRATKQLCLYVKIMKNATGHPVVDPYTKIMAQITFARKVFGEYNRKCCLDIDITWCEEKDPYIPYDAEYFTPNAFNRKKLLDKHKKSCCLTIIYVDSFPDQRMWGGHQGLAMEVGEKMFPEA